MTINHIASIPIGVYENNSFEEHDYFYNLEYHDDDKNFSKSKDTNVLTNTKLKIWIQECINDYSYNCLATAQKLNITQSWCLKHFNREAKVYHHTHPNSIISGAYYIKCKPNSSSLFIKSPSVLARGQIEWNKEKKLIKDQFWLWKNYEIFPKEGMLVLFPSNLEHYVEKKIDKDNRCVLSFNTWFNGPIGDKENLTLLKI